ncbi:TPA: DGQHR domain-containing protein [Enterococcus faecalis]|uniref:DGQHR domain-containing protein n=1 Tax=Enterococcus faecalis TaxID=1351 RepID=UPI000D50C1D7|nr:DGQHR domain-containing protein [Enterococcus faecalis]EIR3826205.1 DGQHR domain-containing protein [Enterococcus faecalis]ELT8966079.1 DGQHR domain-containing protein [Enterococcus faecalis]MBO6438999.1 DGQHR domain-containing protein [Enterococcus faecalis]MBO6452319.1 DGQHR domain-containing protein [Enterococcus faecalis]MDT2164435.1 DGQHR domain-containing protein [Enterococcus faecalis]
MTEELLINREELIKEKKIRATNYIQSSVNHEKVRELEKDGWEKVKTFKKKTRMRKEKKNAEKIVNNAWILFFKLGFQKMNTNIIEVGSCVIDILAVDRETAIFVFCNSTDEKQTRMTLMNKIKTVKENKKILIEYVKKMEPKRKLKCAFIFLTNNYILPDVDLKYMDSKNIVHFDEETFNYYSDLTTHLGSAARFQLLGYLFSGQKIPELNNKIPAIEGKMGGYKYYSFSIEPEKLLKIGYVLHRNNANNQMMPTYQRVIKKSRLESIQSFVDEGGFFPNSLIINIDKQGLLFDRSSSQVDDSISKLGILHLPNIYRSAYIIDGQHRLYGYANSEYATSNTVPVVAFVDLDKKEQVKLFMDINENQKAVSKNLRTTLQADLLWESDNVAERQLALKCRIAQRLGEDFDSPLYGRIIIGENSKTEDQCIKLDTIKRALDKSNFLDMYDRHGESLLRKGTFDTGNNEETMHKLLKLFKETLFYIKNNVEEWDTSDLSNRFVVINPGIYSLIRVIDDVINYYTEVENQEILDLTQEGLMYYIQPFLDSIVNFFDNVTEEAKNRLKSMYGGKRDIFYWRTLQLSISNEIIGFRPDGMEKYWRDNDKRFNDESYNMIRETEKFLNTDFKNKLESYYGEDWFKLGLPKKVYDESIKLAASKNYNKKRNEEVEPWSCLNTIHYREIAIHGKNWGEIFSIPYTMPGEESISGGKNAKTKWIEKFSRIRNENHHTYSISEEEFLFLKQVYEWLIDN